MYLIRVKPDGKRLNGKMNWRVVDSELYVNVFNKKVWSTHGLAGGKYICLICSRPLLIGSYCNPRKLLNI